jgi:Cleft lip and palate transmembrane protein 1 (CLPTM1)
MNPPPAVEAGEPVQGILGQIMSNLPKYIMIYMAINYFASSFKPVSEGIPSQQQNQPFSKVNPQSALNPVAKNFLPKYRFGENFEFKFYISKSEKLDKSARLLLSKPVLFGDYTPFQEDFQVECDAYLKNNGSLYGHYLLDHKDSPIYVKKLLTRYMPRKKVVVKKRLVKDSANTNEPEVDKISFDPKEIISYWWNNVTINLVQMQDPIPISSPPQMIKSLNILENGSYLPILSQNDFWMLSENLQPINHTCTGLTINLSWEPMAFWKFQMYSQFDESFKMQTEVMGADKSESDTVKRMFLDTNPYLLGITVLVSLLHSVFDFLAFKNDISFWKDKKNMEGMSLRTIILNIVFQTITLLYLLDNDTSYMILVSSGIGILIEAWKINKTMITSRIPDFPYIKFTERYTPSRLTQKTQKYDRLAFNYLSYALFPLMLAYTGYSLVYESHKSWYSFVIGTMVGFVYTFGFISMVSVWFNGIDSTAVYQLQTQICCPHARKNVHVQGFEYLYR